MWLWEILSCIRGCRRDFPKALCLLSVSGIPAVSQNKMQPSTAFWRGGFISYLLFYTAWKYIQPVLLPWVLCWVMPQTEGAALFETSHFCNWGHCWNSWKMWRTAAQRSQEAVLGSLLCLLFNWKSCAAPQCCACAQLQSRWEQHPEGLCGCRKHFHSSSFFSWSEFKLQKGEKKSLIVGHLFCWYTFSK